LTSAQQVLHEIEEKAELILDERGNFSGELS
jgi:hypothetical protein